MTKTSVSLIFIALALHTSTAFASDQCEYPIRSEYSIQSEYYGEHVPCWPPTQTVVLSDATRYLNVTRWEVIKLVYGDAQFTWKFDGLKTDFNLQDIAPPDISPHRIMVYIAPRDDE